MQKTTTEMRKAADTATSDSAVYRWFVVFMLMITYTYSFVDRMIINLMVDPIKADFGITDFQMSLLQGISFAVFYTLMGLPIAWLADRSSRKRIIVVGATVWTVMTACCGFVTNYFQLFIGRMGVGVGEASLSPSAYSMLADIFPSNRLARAISVYSLGISVGFGVAYIFGGYVISLVSNSGPINLPLLSGMQPWQLTFVIVAMPGLVIIPAIIFLVREPVRKQVVATGDVGADTGILLFMKKRRRVLAAHFLTFAFFAAGTFGFESWIPTYFMRTRGTSVDTVGLYLGVAYLSLGVAGPLLGAWFCEKLQNRGYHDAIFRVIPVTIIFIIPAVWLLLIAPTQWAYVSMGVYIFLMTLPWGLGAAALQLITPNQYRARVSAIFLFAVNIVGMTVGPSGVAFITDYVLKDEMQVGVSIATTSTIAIIGAVFSMLFGLRAYGLAVKSSESQCQ